MADRRAAERSETDNHEEVIYEINRLLKKVDDCLEYIDEYIVNNLNTKNEFWENNGVKLKILSSELLQQVNFMKDYIHQETFK